MNYEVKAFVSANTATGITTVSVPPITLNLQFDLNLFLEATSFFLAHNQKHNGQTEEQILEFAHKYINQQFQTYKKSLNKPI